MNFMNERMNEWMNFIYIHTYIHIHTNIYTSMFPYMYIHIYIYVYTYVSLHTYPFYLILCAQCWVLIALSRCSRNSRLMQKGLMKSWGQLQAGPQEFCSLPLPPHATSWLPAPSHQKIVHESTLFPQVSGVSPSQTSSAHHSIFAWNHSSLASSDPDQELPQLPFFLTPALSLGLSNRLNVIARAQETLHEARKLRGAQGAQNLIQNG